jgi:hypothetical protein
VAVEIVRLLPLRPSAATSHGTVILPAATAVFNASRVMLARLSSKRTTTAIGKVVGPSGVGEAVGVGESVGDGESVPQGVGVMAAVGPGVCDGVEFPQAQTIVARAAHARMRPENRPEPGAPGFLLVIIRPSF